jgi:hypothetical protein
LGDPWVKNLKFLYKDFIFYPKPTPLGLQAPSSHRMRDNPFMVQYTLKFQDIRKSRGIMIESGKYGHEWYNCSLREFLVANPFPKKTTY